MTSGTGIFALIHGKGILLAFEILTAGQRAINGLIFKLKDGFDDSKPNMTLLPWLIPT